MTTYHEQIKGSSDKTQKLALGPLSSFGRDFSLDSVQNFVHHGQLEKASIELRAGIRNLERARMVLDQKINKTYADKSNGELSDIGIAEARKLTFGAAPEAAALLHVVRFLSEDKNWHQSPEIHKMLLKKTCPFDYKEVMETMRRNHLVRFSPAGGEMPHASYKATKDGLLFRSDFLP